MLALRKFGLLFEALILLGITRVGLRFCHFQKIRRLLSLISAGGRRISRRYVRPVTLVWAVETAKRRSPLGSNCLSEALAAEALFKQFGHDPVLCIGASVSEGKFGA